MLTISGGAILRLPPSFSHRVSRGDVKRLGYRLERVLMIDDTSRKLERHYGNHLRLRPFLGQDDDTELRDVLPFLNILRKAPNLRVIEKRNWRAHHGG